MLSTAESTDVDGGGRVNEEQLDQDEELHDLADGGDGHERRGRLVHLGFGGVSLLPKEGDDRVVVGAGLDAQVSCSAV